LQPGHQGTSQGEDDSTEGAREIAVAEIADIDKVGRFSGFPLLIGTRGAQDRCGVVARAPFHVHRRTGLRRATIKKVGAG